MTQESFDLHQLLHHVLPISNDSEIEHQTTNTTPAHPLVQSQGTSSLPETQLSEEERVQKLLEQIQTGLKLALEHVAKLQSRKALITLSSVTECVVANCEYLGDSQSRLDCIFRLHFETIIRFGS
jgi:D-aminopeptidase